MLPQSEEPWELSEQARQAKSGLPGYVHLLESTNTANLDWPVVPDDQGREIL